MKVVVSGASGTIGSALVPALREAGHEVVRLVRRPSRAADEVSWDPGSGRLDPGGLAGVDAAVNLSGPGVGARRWTAAYKQEIERGRVGPTSTLARALAGLEPRPQAFLSASAIGYYGDTGDAVVDETAAPGSDFLAGVCRRWEAATVAAEDAGIRVVHLRTGIVVSREGGLLASPIPLLGVARVRLLPLFRAGLGGRIGSGRQWMSWVSLTDEVRAIRFLLENPAVQGPVNLTAPEPVTNSAWTAALAAALRRPAILPVPAFALRALVGEFAELGPLVSQRVTPRRLLEAGFAFTAPDVAGALRTEGVARS